MSASDKPNAIFYGVAASPGLAEGRTYVYRRAQMRPDGEPSQRTSEAEWARLMRALEAARADLRAIATEARERLGPGKAAIFAAQELLLEDTALLETARQAIAEGQTAVDAWQQAVEASAAQLRSLPEELWACRAEDVEDVGRRVLSHLAGGEPELALQIPKGSIVLADALTASEMMALARAQVAGVALAHGSLTSHATILAKALGMPLVLGLGEQIQRVAPGAYAVLDGERGTLSLWSKGVRLERRGPSQQAATVHSLPAVTRDGHRVPVLANVGSLVGAEHAMSAGADGIGLLRTELLFLDRPELPDEEEQVATYTAIVELVSGRKVIARTFDLGMDKLLPGTRGFEESNPALGLRGIRASLRAPATLLTQLRALLRASARFDEASALQIMFPMIATVEEWRAARKIVDEAAAQLAEEGVRVPKVSVGMMIEVPAAAVMMHVLAQEAGFFSVGTNDLSQYLMAADRDNAQVAGLTTGLQPALLRLLSDIVRHAHNAGKTISVCGELAADVSATPVLLGLGVDSLSVDASAIPRLRERISGLSLAEARQLAAECLACATAQEIAALISKK